jgi:hypothetical protein
METAAGQQEIDRHSCLVILKASGDKEARLIHLGPTLSSLAQSHHIPMPQTVAIMSKEVMSQTTSIQMPLNRLSYFQKAVRLIRSTTLHECRHHQETIKAPNLFPVATARVGICRH